MRRTWHYDPKTGEMVEGPAPRKTESGDGWKYSDRHYAGLRATDGTDISTRKKHRAYMREKGYTTADDFTEHWKKKAQERADFFEGRSGREERKQDVAQAYEQVRRSR